MHFRYFGLYILRQVFVFCRALSYSIQKFVKELWIELILAITTSPAFPCTRSLTPPVPRRNYTNWNIPQHLGIHSMKTKKSHNLIYKKNRLCLSPSCSWKRKETKKIEIVFGKACTFRGNLNIYIFFIKQILRDVNFAF